MTIGANPPEPWCRNLLHTYDELLDHLEGLARELAAEPQWTRASVWDAYLTVCALSQVLDDFLHRGFSGLAPTLAAVAAQPGKLGRLQFLPRPLRGLLPRLVASRTLHVGAGLFDRAMAARVHLRRWTRERGLMAQARSLHATACALAAVHLGDPHGARPDDPPPGVHLAETAALLRRSARPARLGPRVLKIPSCFKDFDCHPEDCVELARRFAERRTDRSAPVTVVGIRTSGSYLAPFTVATLRALGFTDVCLTSIRQKVALFGSERALLRRRGQAGPVLVVDDPPVTGGAFLQVTGVIERLGVPREQIVSLVLLEEDAPFENSVARRALDTICLPRREWRIERVLHALAPTPGADADLLRHTVWLDGARRSRCHAKLRLSANAGADREPGGYLAKGVGPGWYGEGVRDTAAALGGFVSESSTPVEGVLLARWVDGVSMAERPQACDAAFVRHVASYVAARVHRLPIQSGRSGDIDDRDTGWKTLAQTFARSYSALAPLASHDLRHRLVMVTRDAPRIAIDGKMGPAKWLLPTVGGPPVKVDFEEHGFDRTDAAVFDPALDLGTFCLEHRLSPAHEALLLEEYVRQTADQVTPQRLVVHKLLAGLSRQEQLTLLLAQGGSIACGFDGGGDWRQAAMEQTRLARRLSAIANGFLARALDADGPLPTAPTALFAVDVDGVLEDSMLGFSVTTPAGACAIRTMKQHGFAPVLATGRSLEEMVARARVFGLRAGVAEYGSVVWCDGEEPIVLATAAERAQLATLRTCLAAMPEVIVDDAYTHSVRVFRYRGASREAVPHQWIEDILRRQHLGDLRTIPGEDQIDVVGLSCTKGRALEVLQDRLGLGTLHAVGDTLEDASMLRRATHAYVPANGRVVAKALGGAVYVAHGRRQRGLLQIARMAAHGHPRTCARCAPPADAAADLVLLSAFGIRDQSTPRKLLGLIGPGALRPLLVSA